MWPIVFHEHGHLPSGVGDKYSLILGGLAFPLVEEGLHHRYHLRGWGVNPDNLMDGLDCSNCRRMLSVHQKGVNPDNPMRGVNPVNLGLVHRKMWSVRDDENCAITLRIGYRRRSPVERGSWVVDFGLCRHRQGWTHGDWGSLAC